MIDIARLSGLTEKYDIQLSDGQLGQLDLYSDCLIEWNKKINLTAITKPEEVEIKHFLDCLILASEDRVSGNVVDVGSGAGFPGIVIKLFSPSVDITLMEPTGKRVKFLQEVGNALNIQLNVVKERAEEAARKRWRESFDVATARAVASLAILCEYCLPMVKVGGWFIAMKADDKSELDSAIVAIEKLGGRYVETKNFVLPDGSRRSLVFIEKIKETPKVYPRNGGVIVKRPL